MTRAGDRPLASPKFSAGQPLAAASSVRQQAQLSEQLLNEYRASLIAHSVTGKVDVRAAVGLLHEASERESSAGKIGQVPSRPRVRPYQGIRKAWPCGGRGRWLGGTGWVSDWRRRDGAGGAAPRRHGEGERCGGIPPHKGGPKARALGAAVVIGQGDLMPSSG